MGKPKQYQCESPLKKAESTLLSDVSELRCVVQGCADDVERMNNILFGASLDGEDGESQAYNSVNEHVHAALDTIRMMQNRLQFMCGKLWQDKGGI